MIYITDVIYLTVGISKIQVSTPVTLLPIHVLLIYLKETQLPTEEICQ